MKNDLQTNASNTAEENTPHIKNVETKVKENMTIIRISGGGQYEIDNSLLTQINSIDDQLVNIMKNQSNGQSNPEVVKKELKKKLEEITSFVKSNGRPIMDADIVKSNLYIPNADISVEEAQNVFKDEGIIK